MFLLPAEEEKNRRHLTIAESEVFYLCLFKDLNQVFFINGSVNAVSKPDCCKAQHWEICGHPRGTMTKTELYPINFPLL